MAQQTAVEYLIQEIKKDVFAHSKSTKEWNTVFKEAKAMEKKQIEKAFVSCWVSNVPDGIECKLSANEYYNETYKSEQP